MTSPTRRSLGVAGLVAAALLVFGGIAAAGPSEGAGVIIACVNRKSGEVRINTGARDCTRWEEQVFWNVRGPRGPQGPPGASGLTGNRIITETEVIPARADEESIVAFCPTGTTPTGGGHELDSDNVSLVASAPVVGSGGAFLGWRAAFDNATDQPGRGTVYVICYAAR
ncbi:hypothetical protein [Asanoa siamensis]|uniref:Secreted protein n=1 Tax=Asanoa siamensis TaxID=926357 RepID=A0ABQ4CMY9_9ACTN|nr:hypothetical protein [Asanoa siamensis]GIF72651.1 hypothetical protein Asi02nite_21690 [Asanoa siamensis]